MRARRVQSLAEPASRLRSTFMLARWLAPLSLVLAACAAPSAPSDRPERAPRAAASAAASATQGEARAPTASAAAASSPIDETQAWQPARTRAVIAGVLRWEDPRVSSFSPVERKDLELSALLVSRGVPRERVVTLIDEAARGEAFLAALEAEARAAEPGSTLIVYYAGHGTRAESGEISLLGYDAGPKGRVSMAAIARALADFSGERVLLLADCCHSGGLAEVARTLEARGVDAAAITSAEAANTSTANWTFTQSVIDAIEGDGLGDHDGDGRVELGELATEAKSAMKHRERQRAGVALGRVSGELALARVSLPAPPRGAEGGPSRGDYVEVPRRGSWATARVRERRGETLAVELYDYAAKSIEHVPVGAVRALRFERFEPGAAVRVTWDGRTWDAKVLRVDDDFHLITYPGWSSWWDEWIASDRIVGRR
jgi:hypothetical protein